LYSPTGLACETRDFNSEERFNITSGTIMATRFDTACQDGYRGQSSADVYCNVHGAILWQAKVFVSSEVGRLLEGSFRLWININIEVVTKDHFTVNAQ
jgi:hypothetical protein